MKRKLPVSIQDFVTIRENDYCYVDKTRRIYDLISYSGSAYFLSRPRRFGKSLLCSTLNAIFEGRRELFSGSLTQKALAIDSLDWNWKKYPVIRIDLNPGDYPRGIEALQSIIRLSLSFCEEKYGLAAQGTDINTRFRALIANLYKMHGEKVVVIIDEYDKPLLSVMDNLPLLKEIRSALKSFYGVIKSSGEHLEFVFITGVTKFSKVSVFSDLNNLNDISLDSKFFDICGVTQEELEKEFAPEIESVVQNKNCDRGTYLAELKHYYNGYRFSKKPETVYNPFGLLHHFYNDGDFQNYWFWSGTPTFLLTLIENQHIDIPNLENETVKLCSKWACLSIMKSAISGHGAIFHSLLIPNNPT
jgi:hypothetical protein